MGGRPAQPPDRREPARQRRQGEPGGAARHGGSDDLAISQLQEHTWRENARGPIEIESKESLRARGVKSPDRAESKMLCFGPSAGGSRISGIPVGHGHDDPDNEERSEKPYQSQFASSPIGAAHRDAQRREYSTCGDCAHFKPSPVNDQVGKCELRLFSTSRTAAECEFFLQRL